MVLANPTACMHGTAVTFDATCMNTGFLAGNSASTSVCVGQRQRLYVNVWSNVNVCMCMCGAKSTSVCVCVCVCVCGASCIGPACVLTHTIPSSDQLPDYH